MLRSRWWLVVVLVSLLFFACDLDGGGDDDDNDDSNDDDDDDNSGDDDNNDDNDDSGSDDDDDDDDDNDTDPTCTIPTAAFSADPVLGVPPLTVTFTDQSTYEGSANCAITSWSWSFGDGTSSSDASPLHIFTEAGTYTVTLTVSNEAGSDVETKTDLVELRLKPVADFSADPESGFLPMEVQFTDLSQAPAADPVVSWTWNFGDGETSGEQNPLHTYDEEGDYTVSLQVVNTEGFDVAVKTDYIQAQVCQAPVADFSSDETSGPAPLTIQFADESTLPNDCPIDTWLWDFGDGQTSEEENPSHEFQSPGNYDVSLTVTNQAGDSTETKEEFIHVDCGVPTAAFSGAPLSGVPPWAVDFTDESESPEGCPLVSWDWDFGDGGTSEAQNPSHTYAGGGSYDVSLTVANEDHSDSITMEDYVRGWQNERADTSGDVGFYNSLAADSTGAVHISYLGGTGVRLKYATNETDAWTRTVVDGDRTGQYQTSIALDGSTRPHIAYYESDGPSVRYAKKTTSGWTLQEVDSIGGTGKGLSIAVDSSGNAYISFHDVSGGQLRYAANAGGSWVVQTVTSGGSSGYYNAIVLDSGDRPHIAFYGAGDDLRYATRSAGTWSVQSVDDSGTVGSDVDIAVDDSDQVHISYRNHTESRLQYATNAADAWTIDVVDEAGNTGEYSAICLGEDDDPWIAYRESVSKALRIAHYTDGVWNSFPLDDQNDAGNFGIGLGLDGLGFVHVSYYQYTVGDLLVATDAQ